VLAIAIAGATAAAPAMRNVRDIVSSRFSNGGPHAGTPAGARYSQAPAARSHRFRRQRAGFVGGEIDCSGLVGEKVPVGTIDAGS